MTYVNISAPIASGNFAFDVISGTNFPRGKMTFGEEGVATDVSDTDPLPAKLAADDAGLVAVITALGALSTEAKQDTVIAALAAILGATDGLEGLLADNATDTGLTAIVTALGDKATETKQDAIVSSIDGLGAITSFADITPNDGTVLNPLPNALYIGGAGNISLDGSDDVEATFAVTAGQFLVISPKRINDTDTTASGIVALYI